MDPIATATLKLSANRGTARLWLEGAKLAVQYFPGMVVITPERIN